MDASASLVKTNIPHQQLPDLVEAAVQAKELPMTSVQLVPPLILPADPDFDLIAAEVEAAFAASLEDEPATADEPAAGDESAAADGDEPADGGGASSEEEGEEADQGASAVAVGDVCAYE